MVYSDEREVTENGEIHSYFKVDGVKKIVYLVPAATTTQQTGLLELLRHVTASSTVEAVYELKPVNPKHLENEPFLPIFIVLGSVVIIC